MQYFPFTEKEYKAILDRLDSINEKVSSGNNLKPEEIIYDNADALKILKVSRRTLQSWRTEGLIGFSQIGSKLYYTQRDLNLFVQKHYKKSFA